MDTELGGELLTFDENNDEDKKMESEFALCSRTFKNRRGEFRSPRNVFLHGRGGAKNLSCLYRFEASVGETVSVHLLFYFILTFYTNTKTLLLTLIYLFPCKDSNNTVQHFVW